MNHIQLLQQRQGLDLDIKIKLSEIRIREWINHWGEDSVYISFSGGKDSTVMFYLVADHAKKINRRFGCLFVDLEGQYKLTIKHTQEMFDQYKDLIDPY